MPKGIEEFRQEVMELTTHYENVPVDGGTVCGIDKHRIEVIQIGVNNLITEIERLEKENEELRRTLKNVSENCPNCPNRGWYSGADYYTGEEEQVQCEFCYTNPNSVFNRSRKLTKLQRVCDCAEELGFEFIIRLITPFPAPYCVDVENNQELEQIERLKKLQQALKELGK